MNDDNHVVYMTKLKSTTVEAINYSYVQYVEVGGSILNNIYMWIYKFLLRRGALKHPVENTVEVKRVDINRKKFSTALFEAYMSCFPRDKPTQVYIGPDEFNKILGEPVSVDSGFDFHVPMNYNRTIFNLPVKVVPHMKGILIV